jgi:2-oxoglutarate dehydrogenase E2 component (dihydrolipoamide succinyltransferase)
MIVEVTVPSPGESVTEVTLSAWLKKDGDVVRKDEELFEIESEKATLSVAASAAGKLSVKIAQGETIKVGSVACTIDTSASVPEAKPIAAVEAKPASVPAPSAAPIASPAAQKIMEERNVAAGQVTGTGRGGRITKQDVIAPPVAMPTPEPAPAPRPAAIATPGTRPVRRQKLSQLRMK